MDIEAPTAPAATDEATRNAYNTTFAAMELDWHWDRDTYSRLRADGDGRAALRAYVQQHQPHLLRAYGVDCLIDAIEQTRRALYR
ncbi:MAG TPA: hypothetical protein VMT14_05295 [Burkholderiaceae bacterium]|jgi:hypothetical protein|nr:hypothetical protein [Burkholderiaceae bacterium]